MTFRDPIAFNSTREILNLSSLGGLISYSNSGSGNPFLTSSFHIGKMIYSTSTSANVLRVEPNISPYIGAHFHVLQYGAGKMEILAGSSVTINATTGVSYNLMGGVIYLRTIYASATLINISTNQWVAIGDISG